MKTENCLFHFTANPVHLSLQDGEERQHFPASWEEQYGLGKNKIHSRDLIPKSNPGCKCRGDCSQSPESGSQKSVNAAGWAACVTHQSQARLHRQSLLFLQAWQEDKAKPGRFQHISLVPWDSRLCSCLIYERSLALCSTSQVRPQWRIKKTRNAITLIFKPCLETIKQTKGITGFSNIS